MVYSEALYARYHFGWSELTALTDDRYRYIKAPREELYDLQRDVHERTNIADERPRDRARLRRRARAATGPRLRWRAD
jgi:arylsulfatase A-like enzyme